MTNPPDVIALASFDDYLRAHGDALLVHATIISADPHTAQDVVQAVLERVYGQWNRISQVQHLDAYVRRMVVNEFLSTRRRVSRLILSDRPPEIEAAGDHAGVVSNRAALILELRKLPPGSEPQLPCGIGVICPTRRSPPSCPARRAPSAPTSGGGCDG